jgi:ATP-dependent exoDNAse (exonuclease V) beta subunit
MAKRWPFASAFPVAMIDEFQDTDPQQYRIFAVSGGSSRTPLLLIGDPKQAIYAFRGADIFTYMKARSDVAAHYTLDTNWRSSPAWWKASIACSAAWITPLCSGRSRFCR